MLKCYSSLPESGMSREASSHKDLGCFEAFLHAFPTMVPLCCLGRLCNTVSSVMLRWAQRQWSCKLRPAPGHLHTYYYFESIHGSSTCLIQHFFTISINPLRSEKVQFISSKLKVKGMIWNKESQSNIMKVLGKRVIIQGSPWPERTSTYIQDPFQSSSPCFLSAFKLASPHLHQYGQYIHMSGKRHEFSPPSPTSGSKEQKAHGSVTGDEAVPMDQ